MSQTEGSDSFAFWRSRGVSVRTANILITLGCETIEDVRRFNFANHLYQRGGIPSIGQRTYEEITGLMSGELVSATASPPPIWTPDDIYDEGETVCETVCADEQQIVFSFVCPSEWQFFPTTVMRTKIERGIIFFKPGGKSTGFQEIAIVDYSHLQCRAILHAGGFTGSMSRAFINRMFILIKQMGWTENTPYFVMNPSQRGWYEITKPSAEPPNHDDKPYVLIEIRQCPSP